MILVLPCQTIMCVLLLSILFFMIICSLITKRGGYSRKFSVSFLFLLRALF